MPFTPYHFGPGLFLGLIFLGFIDFPTFLVANIIVDVEQDQEARQIERLPDALVGTCQYEVATVVAPARLLRVDQHAQAGARDVVRLAHVYHDAIAAVIREHPQTLGELGRRSAVDPAAGL